MLKNTSVSSENKYNRTYAVENKKISKIKSLVI